MLRFLIVASIVTFVASASAIHAAPADKQTWDFADGGVIVSLAYAVPESDVGTLSINCDRKRKRIDLVSFVLPPQARPGVALMIALGNGGGRLEYKGRVARDRDDGSYVAARLGFDGKLLDFLNSGGSLTVEGGNARETIPLTGIQKPLAAMRRACLG